MLNKEREGRIGKEKGGSREGMDMISPVTVI